MTQLLKITKHKARGFSWRLFASKTSKEILKSGTSLSREEAIEDATIDGVQPSVEIYIEKPLLRRTPGRPKNRIEGRITVAHNRLSIPKALYQAIGEPEYINVSEDGADLVCSATLVKGMNSFKKFFTSPSGRTLYNVWRLYEKAKIGKYLYTTENSGFRVLSCIRRPSKPNQLVRREPNPES